jgi:hypothetical protein
MQPPLVLDNFTSREVFKYILGDYIFIAKNGKQYDNFWQGFSDIIC